MGWIFHEAYALAFAGHGTSHLPHRLRRLPVEYTGRYTNRAGNAPSVAAIDDAVAAIQEEAEQMAQTSESITPKNPSKILPKESGEAPEAFPSSYALEADSPTEAYSKVLWYIFQYGLLPGETSWPTYTYSERAPGEAAVDGPVYEAWRDSILQDGQPAKVPWLSLTRENIAALGYPEPEMPDWRSYIPG